MASEVKKEWVAGPWHAVPRDDDIGGFTIEVNDGNPLPIAIIPKNQRGQDVAAANAAIFAALPDLVRALQNIEGGYFDGAGTLALSGDWKSFAEHLQEIACAALSSKVSK